MNGNNDKQKKDISPGDSDKNRDENKQDDQQQPQGPGWGSGGGMFKNFSPLIFILLIFLIPWIVTLFASVGNKNQISYSQFKRALENGNLQTVTIQGEKIVGEFKKAPAGQPSQGLTGQPSKSFVTYFPSKVSDELIDNLENQNIEVITKPSSQGGGLALLLNLLPFLLMIGIFYMIWRNMRGRGGGQNIFNVGQSKAKKYQKEQVETTFDDVAGIESAKAELQEIVSFLKDPEKFARFGASTPKGLLLVGPPGSGKTLLARAVAGEADVPFFSISGSDFMEMFVGVGASRVRNLFGDAKKSKPSIIFIDELDSIGRTRGAGVGGGHDEREQTLNQLLSEMDGFEKTESVIVMAATNRPDILDPALQRPGRFDRKVTVTLPTMKDRVAILQIHARGKPLAQDVDLEKVARNTPGFSGADLENLLNEASLFAAQGEKNEIEMEDLNKARDKILLGLERKNVIMTDREKQMVAYHELGHATVATLLPNTDPIHKVTIIPRERAMGVTQQLPERDRYLYDREYLLDRIKVMMGGRAAENFKFQTYTSGAENDLKQAQQLARKMVLDWGMSEKFENIAMGGEQKAVFLGEQISQQRDYSEATNRVIDEEVQRILTEAYDEAYGLLKTNEKGLDHFATRLIEEEDIPGSDLYEYYNGHKPQSGDEDDNKGQQSKGQQSDD
jgi:cell division protease FtsH